MKYLFNSLTGKLIKCMVLIKLSYSRKHKITVAMLYSDIQHMCILSRWKI